MWTLEQGTWTPTSYSKTMLLKHAASTLLVSACPPDFLEPGCRDLLPFSHKSFNEVVKPFLYGSGFVGV